MKRFSVKYFFFLFFFLSLFVSGIVDSQDGFQYLAVARNIYYKGEPTAPEYGYENRTNIHMSTGVAANGKTYSPTGLGYSLALVPAVAVTDLVYQQFDITPVENFPLENDWLILFTSSFTNVIFAALLGVVLYKYLREIKLKHKQALFISFISLIATNLFVLSKHSLPHMMFISFLVLSFYFLKVYSRTKKNKHIIFSGLAYGIVVITYNQTFFLPAPSYILYFLLLVKPKLNKKNLKKMLINMTIFVLGVLPFFIAYYMYEQLKITPRGNISSPAYLARYAKRQFFSFPITIFVEGLWGQLFSPGRSFFLYSPLMLLPVLFWHKIKKKLHPETVVFLTLSVIYLIFYALRFSVGPGGDLAANWHGELSWGPRYLSPLIPFGMLVVGHIYTKLSKRSKLFVFFPLIVIGLFVEMLGIIMPYQLKLKGLDNKFKVNKTQFTNSDYINLIPRYSPIFMMSKKLVKLSQSLPKTLDNGVYNLHFYDGFDFPFNVGPERWRTIEGTGYISLENNIDNSVKEFSLELINRKLVPEASSSASVRLTLNNSDLLKKPEILQAGERKIVETKIDNNLIRCSDHYLQIVNIITGVEPTKILGKHGTYIPKYLSALQIFGGLNPSIIGTILKNYSLPCLQ